MKKTILLVFGGKSPEHEVSIQSARNIGLALDKNIFDLVLIGISAEGSWYRFPDLEAIKNLKTLSDKSLPSEAQACALIPEKGRPVLLDLIQHKTLPVDCAFPITHGTFGEDGCLQGFFQILNIPFVGCDVLSSSISMNKEFMKKIFAKDEIPTARYIALRSNEKLDFDTIQKELGLPFFIKPASMGSSVGVHKIKSKNDFDLKIKDAFLYDHTVLAEELVHGREIECSVLGSRWEAKASICGELIPQHEFYSYEAKYLDENGAVLKIPAEISSDIQMRLQNLALKVFKSMNCEGLARVDFFVNEKGDIKVNELNTLPGFTKISMYPMMWGASGLGYTPLITRLIELAMEKFRKDRSLKTSFLKL